MPGAIADTISERTAGAYMLRYEADTGSPDYARQVAQNYYEAVMMIN
jgi:hypothetical protein